MAFIRCKSLKRITLPNISKRLESIVQAGHVEVLSQIDSIPISGSVERQGSKIFIPASAIKSIVEKGWKKPECLNQVEQLIAYYEMKEATTILFELAVWKVKIDQAGNSVNRDACRVGVPKLVKDLILQYMFNAETSMSVPLEKIYTYTGDRRVPKNVVVVHVHSSVVDIPECKFGQCRYLRTLVLNEGLKKIGTQAFTGCCSLQSISFPSTLTEVDDSAFKNCTSLREVVLNEGLTKIGSATFYNCKSLEHISFPSTLTEVDDSAFKSCTSLREVVLNAGLTKIGSATFYNCKSLEHISFPSTLTEVDDSAFKSCTSLREVVFNEGLQKIRDGVFSGCNTLQSLTLPSTIIEIGSSAFKSCKSFRDVVLNEGLVKIGVGVFSDCNSLQSVSLPRTVVDIGESTFSNCKELKEVVFDEGLRSIGGSAFHNCKSLESISFPSTLNTVSRKAFKSCTSLKEVVLNEGLEKIKSSAFGKCNSLESITLPTTIVEIGSNSFTNCNVLKEVVLNEGLRSIGSSAFYNCRLLEIISFPSTLNTVSRNAFIECKSLKRITLANISKRLESIVQAGHVEVLGQIDSIPMRGSVERQGSEMIISEFAVKTTEKGSWKKPAYLHQVEQLIAYYEMKEATTILFELAVWKVKIDQAGNSVNRDACRVGVPKLVKDLILQYMFNAETSMSVPLEKIYTYTGDRRVPKNVVVVHVHSSVVDIPECKFGQCRYLRTLVLNEGLKKIGTQAFTGCCSLQSISFPSTLTEVDDSAFKNCTSLREVVLNEGLTKIGSATFYNCKSLEHISFPSTLTEVDDSAFKSCTSLREVVLNEGLLMINGSAFGECSSLESVALPSTLNETGYYAFCMCNSLKRITLPYISRRLESIVQAGHVEVISQIDEIRGPVERQGSEIFIPASAIKSIRGRRWRNRDKIIKALPQCLARIKQLIVYHEMKEATTVLFELALWKAMIDQAGDSVNRDACRVGVPKLVKDSILQYLIEYGQDKAKRK